jgi:hypothetical protein
MADLSERIPTRSEMIAELNAAVADKDVERQQIIVRAIAALYPQREPTTGERAAELMLNIVPSGIEAAKQAVTPVIHPIETVKAVGEILSNPEARAKVADYYKQRFGSLEGFEEAIVKDPVGMMMDIATPFTLGGAAVAKVPGVVGRVGKTVEKAASYVDPLTALGKLGSWATPGILGVTTGAGKDAITEAVRVGREGSEKERLAFIEGMRDPQQSFGVSLDAAAAAVRAFKGAYQKEYRDRMSNLTGAYDPIDLTPLAPAVDKIEQTFMTQSGISKLNSANQTILDDIKSDVAKWVSEPREHNAIGLNDLKQKISGYYPSADGVGQKLVKDAQKSIDSLIEDAGTVPDLKNLNNEYSASKSKLEELERTFSLTGRAAPETTLKKLQAATRDNVQTGYGYRRGLLQELEEKTGTPMFPALAGQALSPTAPRGLPGQIGALSGAGSLMWNIAQAAAQGGRFPWEQVLSAPAFSPRLVGEAAYLTGKAQRAAAPLRPVFSPAPRAAAYQAGNVPGLLEE